MSPIQVLTELNVTWLQWSYESWYFQVDKPLRLNFDLYSDGWVFELPVVRVIASPFDDVANFCSSALCNWAEMYFQGRAASSQPHPFTSINCPKLEEVKNGALKTKSGKKKRVFYIDGIGYARSGDKTIGPFVPILITGTIGKDIAWSFLTRESFGKVCFSSVVR